MNYIDILYQPAKGDCFTVRGIDYEILSVRGDSIRAATVNRCLQFTLGELMDAAAFTIRRRRIANLTQSAQTSAEGETMKSVEKLKTELKNAIAMHCIEIEDLARTYGLPLKNVTVIARDPDNDKMIVVVTNEEGDGGLQEALTAAASPNIKPTDSR